MLINPFTRTKKLINSPASENSIFLTNRALLAFGKCSEEFVLVVDQIPAAAAQLCRSDQPPKLMKKIPRNTHSSRVLYDAAKYLKAVKVAFPHNRIKYDQILKLIKLLHAARCYGHTHPRKYHYFLNCVKARVNKMLRGNTDLILGFNAFLSKEHQITLPFQLATTEEMMKKVEDNNGLPLDVLDIISKTLDFDDHFQFAGVCKNWRAFHKTYWRIILASQEPLLLQLQFSDLIGQSQLYSSYSFISIPNQKVYQLEMMKYFPPSNYITCSSGYFIMAGYYNNSFMLINPFTRKKEVINGPASENSIFLTNRAMLAFGKCSEEFVLVVLCKCRLHVYQSRICDWVTYSTMGNSERVVDFVVLHNIIYVVSDMANIGVLNLNSTNVKFLKLKSTPDVKFPAYLKLVNCDEQLLVVDFTLCEIINVYKIDFSTLNYVKLETLGDIALFSGSNCLKRNCYALSNPNRWGYESNSVYNISLLSTICSVYSGDGKKLQKCITLRAPDASVFSMLDWCFRHLRYEVDYSVVE